MSKELDRIALAVGWLQERDDQDGNAADTVMSSRSSFDPHESNILEQRKI